MLTGENGRVVNDPPRRRLVATIALPLLFFAIAAMFAVAAWIRPPLSPDVLGLHVPLGLRTSTTAPEDMLRGDRSIPIDSAGVLLLILISVGTVAVVLKPAQFPVAAGALLSAALAVNLAVALNHPALIERLDSEREQRQDVVRVLRHAPAADPLSTPDNGRVSPSKTAPARDMVWGDLVPPTEYLLFGQWLAIWAALGVWFGVGAPAPGWRHLAGWTTFGVLLGAALSAPRLHAEYHWISANRDEMRGQFAAARASLDEALRLHPDFRRLQRTWILLGKLDYLQGRATPAAALFQAAQLSSNTQGFATDTQQLERSHTRLRRAAAAIEPALAPDFEGSAAARHLAARILTETGMGLFLRPPVFTDGGLDFREHEQRLVAAHEAWRRAIELDPARLDGRIYVVYTHTLLDPRHPERAEANVAIADRMLRADVLNILADAYFRAGRMAEARRRYAESLDLLNLPQRKNFRAQKGIGGI